MIEYCHIITHFYVDLQSLLQEVHATRGPRV